MAAIPQLALGTVAGGYDSASAAVDMSDVHGGGGSWPTGEYDAPDRDSRAATVGKSALPSESGEFGAKRGGGGGWAGRGRGAGAWDGSQRQDVDTSTVSLMTQEPEDRGPGFSEQDIIRTQWVPWSQFTAEQEAKGAPPPLLRGVFLASALEQAARYGDTSGVALAPEDALRAQGLIRDAHAAELEQKLPERQAAAAAASLRRASPSPSSGHRGSRGSLGAGRLNRGLVQRLERIRVRVEDSPPEVAADAVDSFVADLDRDYDELVGLDDVERFARRAGVALPRSLLKAAVVEAFLNRRDGATLRGLPSSTPLPPPPHVAASYTLLSSVSSTKALSKREGRDRRRMDPGAKLAGGLTARESGPRLPLRVEDFADGPSARETSSRSGGGGVGGTSEELLEAARSRRREQVEKGASRGTGGETGPVGAGGSLVLTMPDMKLRRSDILAACASRLVMPERPARSTDAPRPVSFTVRPYRHVWVTLLAALSREKAGPGAKITAAPAKSVQAKPVLDGKELYEAEEEAARATGRRLKRDESRQTVGSTGSIRSRQPAVTPLLAAFRLDRQRAREAGSEPPRRTGPQSRGRAQLPEEARVNAPPNDVPPFVASYLANPELPRPGEGGAAADEVAGGTELEHPSGPHPHHMPPSLPHPHAEGETEEEEKLVHHREWEAPPRPPDSGAPMLRRLSSLSVADAPVKEEEEEEEEEVEDEEDEEEGVGGIRGDWEGVSGRWQGGGPGHSDRSTPAGPASESAHTGTSSGGTGMWGGAPRPAARSGNPTAVTFSDQTRFSALKSQMAARSEELESAFGAGSGGTTHGVQGRLAASTNSMRALRESLGVAAYGGGEPFRAYFDKASKAAAARDADAPTISWRVAMLSPPRQPPFEERTERELDSMRPDHGGQPFKLDFHLRTKEDARMDAARSRISAGGSEEGGREWAEGTAVKEPRPDFALSLPKDQLFDDIPRRGQRGADARKRYKEYDEARRIKAREAGRRAMKHAALQGGGSQ